MSALEPMKLPGHDFLSRLARDDPQEFEVLRTALIENCFSRATEKNWPRLRQLQFRVDGIRRMSKTPLAATLKIQALMWESFLDMNEKLQGFSRGSDLFPQHPAAVEESSQCLTKTARIIEFQRCQPAVERLLA